MDGPSRTPGSRGGSRPLKQRLESLAAAGVTNLPGRRLRRPGRPAKGDAAPAVAGGGESSAEPADPARRTELLTLLQSEVAGCGRCAALARSRTQTVFGTGSPTARLCFLGEAPGADEDASGVPFVGRAGQLLTKIIEACTLTRDEVYILNVLKCRPPDNRTPLPEETANCRGYFERQLEIIAPEYICCLGTTAAQSLLETDETIGRLRKRWFTWRSAQVICTYHPSYLLRNPAAKRDVWDDMKLLMAKLGVQL